MIIDNFAFADSENLDLNSCYLTLRDVEFIYNGGFSVSQKQKNITAIHNALHARFPDKKVLEISSKSMQEGSTELSAFHLRKYAPSLGKSIPVTVCMEISAESGEKPFCILRLPVRCIFVQHDRVLRITARPI